MAATLNRGCSSSRRWSIRIASSTRWFISCSPALANSTSFLINLAAGRCCNCPNGRAGGRECPFSRCSGRGSQRLVFKPGRWLVLVLRFICVSGLRWDCRLSKHASTRQQVRQVGHCFPRIAYTDVFRHPTNTAT